MIDFLQDGPLWAQKIKLQNSDCPARHANTYCTEECEIREEGGFLKNVCSSQVMTGNRTYSYKCVNSSQSYSYIRYHISVF